MKKIFIDLSDPTNKEKLVDSNYYLLFSIYGELVGQGNWERDNDCFYDNDNDIAYEFELYDNCFAMITPTIKHLRSL